MEKLSATFQDQTHSPTFNVLKSLAFSLSSFFLCVPQLLIRFHNYFVQGFALKLHKFISPTHSSKVFSQMITYSHPTCLLWLVLFAFLFLSLSLSCFLFSCFALFLIFVSFLFKCLYFFALFLTQFTPLHVLLNVLK